MKSPDLVVIEWVDAAHIEGWQFGVKPDLSFDSCWTVGFLMAESDDGVVVAQTWYPDDVAHLIQIPRGMIKKQTVLGDLKME